MEKNLKERKSLYKEYIQQMERKRTNGMEVTLKVISHLVKQHVCVLLGDSLWVSSDIKLNQAGIFYVFNDGKFHGCSRIEFEPLRFDFNHMLSVATYAVKVYPSSTKNQPALMEQNSDENRSSRRKPATPRRLDRSVEHYASTPKVGLETDSSNILQQSVLSPIKVRNQEEEMSANNSGNLDAQPVFPIQPVLLTIAEGEPGNNESGEQITEQVKKITEDHAAQPVGFEATEYECRKCSEQFTTMDGYYVHMFSQHKIRNPKRNKPILKRVFQQLNENTIRPNPIGNQDDSMDCGYCDQHYLTHGSLRSHLTKVHVNQPSYFCDTCDRAFYVDSVRDKHCSNCPVVKIIDITGSQITEDNSKSTKAKAVKRKGSQNTDASSTSTTVTPPKKKLSQNTDHSSKSKKEKPGKIKYDYIKRTVTLPSGEKKLQEELVLNGPLKCHLCRIGLHTEETLLLHIKAHKKGKPVDEDYIAERKKQVEEGELYDDEVFNTNDETYSHDEKEVDESSARTTKNNNETKSDDDEEIEQSRGRNTKKKVRVMKPDKTPEKEARKRRSSSSSMTPSRKSPRIASKAAKKHVGKDEQITDKKASTGVQSGKVSEISDGTSSSDDETDTDDQIEDITPGTGPKKIFSFDLEPKKDMKGNLNLANYWAKAAKCEKLRSKKKEFLEKSDFFMKHYMDMKKNKGITGAATIPEITSKRNTRSNKRTADSSPTKTLHGCDEPKKQKLMSTSEAKKVLAAAKKCIGAKKTSTHEQITDEEENNVIPPSPEPKAKKPKKFLTKDPSCKHDRHLMKAKKYELRSQDKKKKQDGDCSKDVTWEPNTSDEMDPKVDEVPEVENDDKKSVSKGKPNRKTR